MGKDVEGMGCGLLLIYYPSGLMGGTEETHDIIQVIRCPSRVQVMVVTPEPIYTVSILSSLLVCVF
jgi:hypothetical protein